MDDRASRRVPFARDVQIIGVGSGRASDLSVGGMYLETNARFSIGTLLRLRFKLEGSDEIETEARVLYIHPGIGAGLAFVKLSNENSEKIENWIRRALASGAG